MVNDRMNRIEETMAGIGDTFQKFMEQQTPGKIPSSEGQNDEEPRDESDRLPLLRQFQNLGPPTFRGATNPSVAEAWVQKVEKMFEVLRCTNRQRVDLAVYMLDGEAEHWWNGVKEGLLWSEGATDLGALCKSVLPDILLRCSA